MPKIKFTAKKLQSLKADPDKSIDYFDSSRTEPGSLGIRVSPKGKKTFFCMFYAAGKVHKRTLGTFPSMSLKESRKAIQSVMVDFKSPVKENDHEMSFSDLWDVYTASRTFRQKAESSRTEEQRKYNRLLRDTIGPLPLKSIRKKHLSPILDDLAVTAPVNANRLHSLLSFVFNMAVEKDFIEFKPLGKQKPGGREIERTRCLDIKEIRSLWRSLEAAPQTIRDIFRLILLTAARPGEVMAIRTADIDLTERTWIIPANKTKTGVEHVIPLSDAAMEIIRPLMGESTYLFPADTKTGHVLYTAKSRIRFIKKFGFEHFTAHDLRRSSATLLNKLKVSDIVVEKILNHSMGKIKRTYNRYSFYEEKREALQLLGKKITK